MDDIMKIVKFVEKFGLLVNCVSETIQNEAKQQKDQFLGMLLVTLAASVKGNTLSGKGVITAGEGTIRTG